MGRASRFFPSRKATKDDRNTASNRTSHFGAPWTPRPDDGSISYSKAERLLGTAHMPFRPSSNSSSNRDPPTQNPGFLVTDTSFDHSLAERPDSMAVESGGYASPGRPVLSNRASSNLLPRVYLDGGRNGSQPSSIGRSLAPQASTSSLSSYYDAQKSPLSVSQQTSASAVRDMALRKGKPQIGTHHEEVPTLRPSTRQTAEDFRNSGRKEKPVKLDLSKLFPKPRHGADTANLLSPNKMVSSPSAMSSNSEFPRPMTREPTPIQLAKSRKLTKSKRQEELLAQPAPRSRSPKRLFQPDPYDSAKINVRRPPRGVQHWFDALDDDTDEDTVERDPIVFKEPLYNSREQEVALQKSPSNQVPQYTRTPPREQVQKQSEPRYPKPELSTQAGSSQMHKLYSPKSQASFGSSNVTKESTFTQTNLQNSSVLSISSSSEDEEDDTLVTNKDSMRDSLGSSFDQGEVVIGKAQAFDIRPPPLDRRISNSKMSMLTTSTTAATIDIMYTPEGCTPQMFPKPPATGSRRSSHVRQPSTILEDPGVRPKTAGPRTRSPSTSVRSGRTSVSEPRTRNEGHKLMEVTEEEQALLEMMRKKRAAMARYNAKESKSAVSQASQPPRQQTPPDTNAYRTSAFLANETPSGSPARAITIRSRKPTVSSSPMLQPPPRGRPAKTAHDLGITMSTLQDSPSCDESSEYRASTSHDTRSHQLSLPPEFSPIDLFPSPGGAFTDYTSIASPTTTDHPSSLPSPITPGLRHGEADVDVKVASSEPSFNGDNEDPTVLEAGVIDPPEGGVKPQPSRESITQSGHTRRRTASSGANVGFSPIRASFPLPPSTNPASKPEELAPVSEASSRPPSVVIEPEIPRRSSKRKTGLTLNTSTSRSRNSSFYSSRGHSPATTRVERRSSKALSGLSRGNSFSSSRRDSAAVNSRCSVSEDILAAWGELGGGRIVGM